MTTIWLYCRSDNTLRLVAVPRHMMPFLRVLRVLCDGEWFKAYEWLD